MSAKKIFSACLALIFATTIFSGCSNTQVAAGGGGGGLTIIVVFELLDHFSSFALNSEAIMKKHFGDDDETDSDEISAKAKESKTLKSVIEDTDDTAKNNSETAKDEANDDTAKNNSDNVGDESDNVLPTKTAGNETAIKINKDRSTTNSGKLKKIDSYKNITTNSEKLYNVKYEKFADTAYEYGYSVDSPSEGVEDVFKNERDKDWRGIRDTIIIHPGESNVLARARYTLPFVHSVIEMVGTSDKDVSVWQEKARENGSNWKDFEIIDMGDRTYLITWIDTKARKDHIVKTFFGEDHYGRKQQNYIEYTYSALNTPEKERQIAQHMINSFQSGFNK